MGVTPMSITYHVGTRAQLLRALVEKVYAGVAVIPEFAEPNLRMRGLLQRYCESVTAHPHLALCILADPSLWSEELKVLTAAIRECLRELRVPPADLETVLGVMIDYVHGFAFSAAASRRRTSKDATPTLDDFLAGLDWLQRPLGV